MRGSIFLVCTLAAAMMAAAPAVAGEYDADNSAKNARDRGDQSMTPGDQGRSAADRELAANIRKAIVDDDALSMNAHNVKIIANGGVVTLRGPVKNAAEKTSVAAKAHKVAGVKRVDNQLEIEKN